MNPPTKSRVLVWDANNEFEKGLLEFNEDDVSVLLDSGRKLHGRDYKDATYSIDVEKIPEKMNSVKDLPLPTGLRIFLSPVNIVKRPYTFDSGLIFEDIFPPSSHGLYNRIIHGKRQAIYTIQKIQNDSRLWLTVSEPSQNLVYEAQRVHPYEVEALQMDVNNEIDKKLYQKLGGNESAENIVSRMLDVPSPSWMSLAKLVSDVSVPNLKIGKTMRETVSQLVPSSFPENVREELMAFLALVIEDKIPKQDPVEYSFELLPITMTGALLRGHLRCMIDETTWPSYVKLMAQASRGYLDAPKRALPDLSRRAPWKLFWEKCFELFPSWLTEAVSIARELNNTSKLVVNLPVSKSAAKRSRNSWKSRLAALTYDLKMRGYVRQSAIGLTDLVYMGSAYRWPHRHMKFITRLGDDTESVPYLQVLTMPLSAVERVKRALPSIIPIAWSTRRNNLDLFSDSTRDWQIQEHKIINSIHGKMTLRKLGNRFGLRDSLETHKISSDEAKVLDLVTSGIDLADLENPGFLDFWQLSMNGMKKVLKRFMDRELIRIQYEVADNRLVSIATVVQGLSDHVISLVAAFLENTPTSTAMISDDEETGIIISRLPESSAYQITSNLPKEGYKQELQIRCLRPTSFKTYTYNLYQRLLRSDGTWDDDVSAFLSQARSKRKELSESNA